MKTAIRILDRKGHLIISIDERTPFHGVIDVLASHRIGAVLVTNASCEAVGIVSERDIVGILAKDPNATKRSASEFMTPYVVTCSPEDTEEAIIKMMAAFNIRHLPVSRDGEVIGMVSARDVLGIEAGKSADGDATVAIGMPQRQDRAGDKKDVTL